MIPKRTTPNIQLIFYFFSAEKHSLRYFLTASSGVSDFPEFVAEMMVDHLHGGYCDSSREIPKPREEWAVKMIQEDPKLFELYENECNRYQRAYREQIKNLKEQFNQSGGTIS